jgi:hypothetical protein
MPRLTALQKLEFEAKQALLARLQDPKTSATAAAKIGALLLPSAQPIQAPPLEPDRQEADLTDLMEELKTPAPAAVLIPQPEPMPPLLRKVLADKEAEMKKAALPPRESDDSLMPAGTVPEHCTDGRPSDQQALAPRAAFFAETNRMSPSDPLGRKAERERLIARMVRPKSFISTE